MKLKSHSLYLAVIIGTVTAMYREGHKGSTRIAVNSIENCHDENTDISSTSEPHIGGVRVDKATDDDNAEDVQARVQYSEQGTSHQEFCSRLEQNAEYYSCEQFLKRLTSKSQNQALQLCFSDNQNNQQEVSKLMSSSDFPSKTMAGSISDESQKDENHTAVTHTGNMYADEIRKMESSSASGLYIKGRHASA